MKISSLRPEQPQRWANACSDADGDERLFCQVVMTELIDGFKVIKTQIVPKLPSLSSTR